MLTVSLAILFMSASLMESVLFFLIKETYVYPCLLHVTSLRNLWAVLRLKLSSLFGASGGSPAERPNTRSQ
jgi:hypothetical protein